MQWSNASRNGPIWRCMLLVALLTSATTRAVAEPPTATLEATVQPRVPAISDSLQQFVDRGDLAGAVMLVAQHGKLVHLDAVGYADVES